MDTLRTKYPLKPIKIFKKSLSSLVLLSITALVVSALIMSQDGAAEIIKENIGITVIATLTWILLAVFLALDLFANFLYFRSYFYDTDGKNLTIRKGIIAKREITLPYSRITDIYVDQDMFDRIFGLFDLHFSTATARSGLTAHIDGLCKADCESLKQFVLDKVNERD